MNCHFISIITVGFVCSLLQYDHDLEKQKSLSFHTSFYFFILKLLIDDQSVHRVRISVRARIRVSRHFWTIFRGVRCAI